MVVNRSWQNFEFELPVDLTIFFIFFQIVSSYKVTRLCGESKLLLILLATEKHISPALVVGHISGTVVLVYFLVKREP